jgi:hypothetical protein
MLGSLQGTEDDPGLLWIRRVPPRGFLHCLKVSGASREDSATAIERLFDVFFPFGAQELGEEEGIAGG